MYDQRFSRRGGNCACVVAGWCRCGGAEVVQEWCRSGGAGVQGCRCRRCEDVLGRCRGSAEEAFVHVIVQV
jgi:hypothetical protein